MVVKWWSRNSPCQYVPRWYNGRPKILYHRKHSIDEDTGLGPAKDPPILKLTYSLLENL